LGHISAAEAGIHDTVQHIDRSISALEISEIKKNLINEGKKNLALAVELQENFGLRFRESIGLNIETAKESLKTGILSVGREDWTKNGREREIPITTAEQKTVLEKVIENIQNREVVNLAGAKDTRDYAPIKEAYREAYKEGIKFHAIRHAWAQEQYSKGWEQRGFQGIQAPIKFETKEAFRENLQEKTSLSISEAREIDREIRQEISEQLGHSRLDVTNTYLGVF
jgi:integrase